MLRVTTSGLAAFAALGACVLGIACAARAAADTLMPVMRQNLCVTEGAVGAAAGSALKVDSAKMRAYVNIATRQIADAHFTYLGATADSARLGSGVMRRQFGLKLNAQDACNLVYVMWRIERESKLVVSVKTNPGQTTSAQCGNRGYRNIKPLHASAIPVLKAGDAHTLHAELNQAGLRVLIDNSPVWEGALGPEAQRLNGPVGIRSDNARLELELKTGAPLGAAPGSLPDCRSGAAETE
jgi:hypothetical protein